MMNSRPTVSIIMNCHNCQSFLKESLDSVILQTYQDWEVIFWDNASSDDSAEIIRSYNNLKINYYRTEELVPLYTARNLALEKCKGKYISFLDCDDVWLQDKLSLQIKEVEKGAKIVYGGYDVINEKGVLLKKFSHNLPSGRITNKLFNKNYISIGCILIKRELFLTEKFDDRYDLMGDMDLWIRLSLVNDFHVVPKTLEYSRIHDSNTSKNLSHKWLFEKRMLYRKILKISAMNILKYPWLIYFIVKTEVLGLREN
jgi:glycosyltransferase involved in cell wall biosynthesis